MILNKWWGQNKILLSVLLGIFLLIPLYAHSDVRVDAYYRLWGQIVLYSQADFSADAVQYVTLNHEGGLPIKILEVGSSAERDGKAGIWVRVMTTSWAWAQGEKRVPQYEKFWVFLGEDDIVQPER